MDAKGPRSWQFAGALPWWFWMCVVIPGLVLAAMAIAPLPERPWVGPEPKEPQIWMCEPESVWTDQCTEQMPALYRRMPDALSIRIWSHVVLPRMDPEDLEALAAGEPFREGAETAWLEARVANPAPVGEAKDYMWAWSFYQVFREQLGESYDIHDTQAVVGLLPQLIAEVDPERREHAAEVARDVEARWRRVGGVEVAAALERLKAPYHDEHAMWEYGRSEAAAFDLAQQERRARQWQLLIAAGGWWLVAVLLGFWLRRPVSVRITPQVLEIGGTAFEWMDVEAVHLEFGRPMVVLRDGSTWRGPLLASVDVALEALEPHIRGHLRTEATAVEEQVERARVQQALAGVREGDDRQP